MDARFYWLGTLLALGFGLGASACFIEPAQPSTFRFNCSADADCGEAESCVDGLCQQPCGSMNDQECNSSAPLCLNGYCSSVCPLSGDDVCPSPQMCMSLSADPEEPGESGVCTAPCSDASPCPDGQVCFEDYGLCVGTCMTVADCGSGEECLGGFCVPSSSGGGGFP